MAVGARWWVRFSISTASLSFLHAAPADTQQPSPQRVLINQYCVTCHNEKAKTAGLMLDKLDVDHVGPNAETWEKVVRKLRVGAMPPQGMPRPDRAAMDSLAASIETSLDRAAAAAPNPGRPVLHRLNRTEYANAIRDLLALDVDPSAMLPTDDASFGFDNIASVLGVSPALLERYLLASAKISRLAVGDPKTDPITDTYRVRADLTQNEHLDGLPLGTRGGILIHHNFPLDGEYVIKVKLLKSTVDLLFGNNAQDQLLEIALNGERVQTLSINPKVPAPPPAPPPSPVADKSQKPKDGAPGFDPAAATKLSMSQPKDNVETRIHVIAGPQTVSVAFIQTQLRSRAGSDAAAREQHLRSQRSQGTAARVQRRDQRSVQSHRLGRHAQPPQDLRVPSGECERRTPLREEDYLDAGAAKRIAGRRPMPIWKRCSASTRLAAIKDGFEAGHRDGAAAHALRSAVRVPLRARSRQRARPTPTIASAIWNSPRGSRSSCGAAFRTTS